MANCDRLFKEFNKDIKLTDKRRGKLKRRRNDLRERIKSGYRIVKASERYQHEIQFQSQGSYIMDTIINPENIECEYDLDDGLYFFGNLRKEDRPKQQTFHDWVIQSIKQGKSDRNYEEIKDKPPCVRVKFKSPGNDFNYHIDIPIYYANTIENPELAHLQKDWPVSHPVAFIFWFETKINSGFKKEFILEKRMFSQEYEQWLTDIRKRDHQLRRIVRFLKAWGDHIDGDMPAGIVMTILAAENYHVHDRDDVSLLETLLAIQGYLQKNGFKCPRPTAPIGEDLFEHYTQDEKDFFKNKIAEIIKSATLAIKEENQKEACRHWKEHLGKRFPCNLAKDDIEGSDVHEYPTIIKSSSGKSA